jgi:hypothetical protein
MVGSEITDFVFSAPDHLRVLDRRHRVYRSWNLNKRRPESRLKMQI